MTDGHGRDEFEEGYRDVIESAADILGQFIDTSVFDLPIINANTLCETDEVRRCKKSYPETPLHQYGFNHCGSGALTIRSCDVYDFETILRGAKFF